jgi:serine/threonine protein kinase/class 3 adenylate cyclase
MSPTKVEELLNARAEIDEQLRRHKNLITVLFTDVVGSTSYFDRFGDTAGLAMVHQHAEFGSKVVKEFSGKVIKTIGDSIMADFSDAHSAVEAAIEMQRRLVELNTELPEHRRLVLRIGVHSGMGFRKGNDVFGDVVNLASRITRRSGAAQILISRTVYEAVSHSDLNCRWLDKCTIDGRAEKEDIYEVVWTDAAAYDEIRQQLSAPHHAAVESAPLPNFPSRYTEVEKIGQGGMGIVYKARDLETSEVLALKVLKPEIASDPVVQANFNKELCLARKITHKNVCRIYDLYRNGGIAFASMEYIEGQSLLDVLNREAALPIARATEMMRQICAGVREAHEQGVVHRDLKPANFMVDANGTVKVMDFGIARMIQAGAGQTGSIVGTPAYMSPEQATGKTVDARTDIYAMGLVFYEMITGKPAFDGDSSVAVALKQVMEAPRPPHEIISGLPRHLESAILKCLEKDPAKRFQSIAQLEEALTKHSTKVRAEKEEHAQVEKSEMDQIAQPSFAAGIAAQWAAKSKAAFSQSAQRFADLHLIKNLQKWIESGSFQQCIGSFCREFNQNALSFSSEFAGRLKKLQTRELLITGGGLLMLVVSALTVMHVHQVRLARLPHRTPVESVTGVFSQGQMASRDARNIAEVKTFEAQLNTAKELTVAEDAASKHAAEMHAAALRAAKAQKQAAAATNANLVPMPSSIPLPVGALASQQSQNLGNLGGTAFVAPKTAPPVVHAAHVASPDDKYFDVGSFKETSWADRATGIIKNLGLETHTQRKGKLWMNSYHVVVGPFDNDAQANSAKKLLEANGFKPHPTKLD